MDNEHKKQITPEERRRQLEEIEERLRTAKVIRVIPAGEIIKPRQVRKNVDQQKGGSKRLP
jgi:hypothetical protein